MGFFDLLRKSKNGNNNNSNSSTKIDNSSIDNEAMSSLSISYSKLENNLGLKITGRSGILVKSVGIEDFNEMKQHVDNYLSILSNEKNSIGWNITHRSQVDEQGYLWFIIEGKEIQEIVVAISSIGDTIHEKGFSRQLLAAIFEFTTGYSVGQSDIIDKHHGTDNTSNSRGNLGNNKSQFLIYNYKIDKFYPFVPLSIASSLTNAKLDNLNKKRNHDLELKIMEQLQDDIPFEKNQSLWYPIWNVPFD